MRRIRASFRWSMLRSSRSGGTYSSAGGPLRSRFRVRMKALVSECSVLFPIEKSEHQLDAEHPRVVVSVRVRRGSDHSRIGLVRIRNHTRIRSACPPPVAVVARRIVAHVRQHHLDTRPEGVLEGSRAGAFVRPSQPAAVRDGVAEVRNDRNQRQSEEITFRGRTRGSGLFLHPR